MSDRQSRHPGGWYGGGRDREGNRRGWSENRYRNNNRSYSSGSGFHGDRRPRTDSYGNHNDRDYRSQDHRSDNYRRSDNRNGGNYDQPTEGKPSGSSPLARYVSRLSHGANNGGNSTTVGNDGGGRIPKRMRRDENSYTETGSRERTEVDSSRAMEIVVIDDDETAHGDTKMTVAPGDDVSTSGKASGNDASASEKSTSSQAAKKDEDEKQDPPEVVEWKQRIVSQLPEEPDGGIASLHIHLPQECLQPESNEHAKRKEEAVRVAVKMAREEVRKYKDEDPDNALIYSSGDDDDEDFDDKRCSNGMAYYGPSSDRKKFVYSDPELTQFFSCLTGNLVFNMGFNVMGLSSRDENHCYCPCSGRMRKWRQDKRNDIDDILQGSDKCGASGTFSPKGLLDHLEKVPGPLHRGAFHYLKHLYLNHNDELAHKAFYNLNTKGYRDAEAAQQRRLYRSKQKLVEELAAERKEKEEYRKKMKERDDEMAKLRLVNKHTHDKLLEERKILSALKLENEKKKELTEKQVARFGRQYDCFWKTLGLGHGTRYSPHFGEEVEDHVANNAKPEDSKITLEVPQCFNLNDVFRDWSSRKKDSTVLFRELTDDDEECEDGYHPEQIRAGDLLVKMNVKFGKDLDWSDDEEEDMERDTLRDEGGPLREFLSQVWLQLGGLGVPVPIESDEIAISFTKEDGDLQVGQKVWVMEERSTGARRRPEPPRLAKVAYVHPKEFCANGACLYDVEYDPLKPTNGRKKTRRKKLPTEESMPARKDCDDPAAHRATLVPAELFVQLFESTDGGFVPLTNEKLRENIDVSVGKAQILKTSRGRDSTRVKMVQKLVDKAKLYYRAIGRIMIHSLVTFHPISHAALPNLYRNVVMRGIDPSDEEYPDVDLVKDLREIGFQFLSSTEKMNSIIGTCTVGDLFGNDDDRLITRENLMDVLSKQVVSCRSDAIAALLEGFTLNRCIPVHDQLACIPLEIVSKKAFTLPSITADDVIAVLIPKYMGENAEEGEPTPAARKVFEEVLPQLLREEWEAEERTKGASGVSKHEAMGFVRQFVSFTTGMAFLPFVEANSKFHITVEFAYQNDAHDELTNESLPSSHTCHNTLVLPAAAYGAKKETLKQRLETSFSYSHGAFGMR